MIDNLFVNLLTAVKQNRVICEESDQNTWSITVNSGHTGWCAQHDYFRLETINLSSSILLLLFG